MKKNIRYTKAPKDIEESLERSVEVPDFLPSPDMLVHPDERMRITIYLNKRIIDFFKQQAEEHNVKYQTMINNVLGVYASKYKQAVKQSPTKSKK